jgi:hypothetical protein
MWADCSTICRSRKAHIAGYSMAGSITGRFITMHPERAIAELFGGSSPRIGWTPENERAAEETAEFAGKRPGRPAAHPAGGAAERAEAVGGRDRTTVRERLWPETTRSPWRRSSAATRRWPSRPPKSGR